MLGTKSRPILADISRTMIPTKLDWSKLPDLDTETSREPMFSQATISSLSNCTRDHLMWKLRIMVQKLNYFICEDILKQENVWAVLHLALKMKNVPCLLRSDIKEGQGQCWFYHLCECVICVCVCLCVVLGWGEYGTSGMNWEKIFRDFIIYSTYSDFKKM